MILITFALVLAASIGLYAWYTQRDYGAAFVNRRGHLVRSERQEMSRAALTAVYDVQLASDTGLTASGRMRAPLRQGKFTGVLLAVGIGTGAKAIDLIGDHDGVVLLSLDYGWTGEFDVMTAPKLWQSLNRMRKVSTETIPRLLLGVEMLARHPQVDPDRIVMVGVSYGTYCALPAAVIEPRASRLILVQGGGRIGDVIAANATEWKSALPPRAAGQLGELIFAPFRPERWIDRLAPRPVTFIASRTDPTLPVGAIERIYALAHEPKELVWHDTPHVGPDQAKIIAELSRIVMAELGGEPASP